VRAGYERAADLDDVLGRVRGLRVATVVFDVEPLVAGWGSGQAALDEGAAAVASQAVTVAGVQVVCFSTNSARRPAEVPRGDGTRVVWLTLAGKPLRIAPYRDFPGPGVVVGDQVATDGMLARRLGYTFVHYRPRLGGVPAGPRLMGGLGRLVRPLVFTRPG
jgi:predicted HAD superfamily phosphohydrolase YqeG